MKVAPRHLDTPEKRIRPTYHLAQTNAINTLHFMKVSDGRDERAYRRQYTDALPRTGNKMPKDMMALFDSLNESYFIFKTSRRKK